MLLFLGFMFLHLFHKHILLFLFLMFYTTVKKKKKVAKGWRHDSEIKRMYCP